MFSAISSISSGLNTPRQGIKYKNIVYTSGLDTLTQLNTIKMVNYVTTNSTSSIPGNSCGISNDKSLIAIGYIGSTAMLAISKNGGETWINATLPTSTPVTTGISDICLKGTSSYCGIFFTSQIQASYCDLSTSTTFTQTSALVRNCAGIRFPSSTTTTTGNLWLGFTGGAVRSTAGFGGAFSGVGQSSSTYCIDSPDDDSSYAIFSGSWGGKFFSPTVVPTTQVSITGFPTNIYSIATSQNLSKTIMQSISSTLIISNFNTTSGTGGTSTMISNTNGIPSTAGCGSNYFHRTCAISLNGNVIAFIDLNTSGSVGTCWYSVNGGSSWTNLNSQYSITATFVSLQISRDANYIILQALDVVYLLSFGTQY